MTEPSPFGKYLLHERIAVGGMAAVYRAQIPHLRGFAKNLAIKQILPQYSAQHDFIEMFLDEARITIGLNHANIVPVYELGEIDDTLYMAMEWIDGWDLSRVAEGCDTRGWHVPQRLAAYIIAHVCRGLHYAHTKQDDKGNPLHIIHRDVSPNNVIIANSGDIKVIDFGIAKATIKVSVTQVGTLKGKVIYMSPEQATDKPLDHRSDIFSAGAVLYELVTGVKAYSGETFAVIQDNVKVGHFPRPRDVHKDTHPDLEAIILRAMERDPARRYQTAFEMERALWRYITSTGEMVFAQDVAGFMQLLMSPAADHVAESPLESETGANTDPSRAHRETTDLIPEHPASEVLTVILAEHAQTAGGGLGTHTSQPSWSQRIRRVLGSWGKPKIAEEPRRFAPAIVHADTISCDYRNTEEFHRTGYLREWSTPAIFFPMDESSLALGQTVKLVLTFLDVAQTYRLAGRVIWRRARTGMLGPRELPAGLAIELCNEPGDDYEIFRHRTHVA